MGNSQAKESRDFVPSSRHGANHRRQDSGSQAQIPADRLNSQGNQARGGRGSRPDLSFLGIGNGTVVDAPEVRRETKQEREARKLEKERLAREKERERSMREEHVDGGFLVTQGVYTGTEDFNKTVVRQLMIERRMAPFWRGLNDFKEDWTEYQLVAAARALPIPPADYVPPEEEMPRPIEAARSSTPNLQNLTVPISSRSQSLASDVSANLSASHPAFSSPSPSSPASPNTQPTSSLLRPRSKTLASLATSLKNQGTQEIAPREIQLPKDPFVNGQMMEAFLYKDACECPICFIYYPPYLNKTRCCDQAICSECFVQIKRPDPHPPEHEHPNPSNPTPPTESTEDHESLVSEPANCPYCQQAEFGITFEPVPFKRGLAYANSGYGLSNAASAMSSSTSLNSVGSPSLSPTPAAPRRRTTSISANASTVITTDRVRPDWATKLANARNHAARRSAAATALHTAAYLMGNGAAGADQRTFGFSGRRFGRSRGDSPSGSGTATPSSPAERDARIQQLQTALADARSRENSLLTPGQSSRDRRRSRMEDLEDMMMMEAIRLSLAAEEERKRKEEKLLAKEAKKKEKAEKKQEKKERKGGMYSGSTSPSPSGSALSLALSGAGRRRGNSGSSAFLREATMNSADKGKSVDRGMSSSPDYSSSSSAPITIGQPSVSSGSRPGPAPRQHLDMNLATAAAHDSGMHPSPTAATQPDKPSHLRQMSNASSPASSFIESVPGSLRNGNGFHGSSSTLDSANASRTKLARNESSENSAGRRGDRSETPDIDRDGSGGTPSTEPMFNFRSLAAMIDREDEKEKAQRKSHHVEYSEDGSGTVEERDNHRARDLLIPREQDDDDRHDMEESQSTIKIDGPYEDDHERGMLAGHEYSNRNETSNGNNHLGKAPTPALMLTPVTPAAMDEADEDSKQLGAGMTYDIPGGTEISH